MRPQLPIMEQAARAAGEKISEYFGTTLTMEEKSTAADFRTQADTASEETILALLKQHFPDYGIIAEESGVHTTDSEYTFVIDPLDGTNNFSLGIPLFSVSIGLMQNGRALAGVVYNPISQQLYSGEVDSEIAPNKKSVQVNSESDPERMTISYMQGYTTDLAPYNRYVTLHHKTGFKRLLSSWSPALDLALLASGKIEGIICNGAEIYDYAAGLALVKAAGGNIIDMQGKNIDRIPTNGLFIAANTKNTALLLLDLWHQAL